MSPALRGFKPGTKVTDTWYLDWGIGKVVRRTSASLYVQFIGQPIMRWDIPHVRGFLRRYS